MSSKRGAWISRRGQADAEHAIDQVIDRQFLPGEQVQHVADDQIEDSPYQARQPFSDADVQDLVQGMREAGFQGVLIVRLHGDLAKRRRGLMQLVYGHRRRAAWRLICAERGQPCLLPAVVREINDAQMLTIGAQENLQRQDLDPVEEAQIVAWHEQVFFDKNQAELGVLLGKSSDWVSVRSRIHRLPDGLKERLRLRPRTIAQMLDLGSFYTHQPDVALALADQVIQKNLSLDAIRGLVRGYARPQVRGVSRTGSAERRGTATKVREITSSGDDYPCHDSGDGSGVVMPIASEVGPVSLDASAQQVTDQPVLGPTNDVPVSKAATLPLTDDREMLWEIANRLRILAERADRLSRDTHTEAALEQIATALRKLQRGLGPRDISSHAVDRDAV